LKRVCSIFLGLLLAAGLLGGCAGPAKAPVSSAPPGLSEDEARQILTEAVAAGEAVLKKFYLSPSLRADAEDTLPGREETYIRVTEEGFASTADIQAATEKAFTPEAAAELFYAEYLEGDSPVYLDAGGGLYEAADGGKNYTITWLCEKAALLSQSQDSLRFRVPRLQLEEKIPDGELTLKKVQGFWLLDSGLEAV
jgi:lipoprotein